MLQPAPMHEGSGSTTGPGVSPQERLLTEMAVLRRQVAALCDELLPCHRTPHPGGEAGDAQTDMIPTTHAVLYGTCFGTFALYRAGTRLPLGHDKPAIALCRYLVAHAGQMVPREELLELLWPEADPPRAVHRLHVAISSLRRVLDPARATESLIQLGDDSYTIAADGVVTDCDLFEKHYRRGRVYLTENNRRAAAAAFRAALALYAGDYLADDPYAEWTHKHRAHFAERRLSALTFLCEHAVLENTLASVVEYAQQILEIDNLRERSHRHLMRAHYSMGQRACAIRQYNSCAKLLMEELGIRPSQQTQRLYRAICDDTELPSETPIGL